MIAPDELHSGTLDKRIVRSLLIRPNDYDTVYTALTCSRCKKQVSDIMTEEFSTSEVHRIDAITAVVPMRTKALFGVSPAQNQRATEYTLHLTSMEVGRGPIEVTVPSTEKAKFRVGQYVTIGVEPLPKGASVIRKRPDW